MQIFVLAQVRVLLDPVRDVHGHPPRTARKGAAAAATESSDVTKLFAQLRQNLHEGQLDAAKAGLEVLQEVLTPMAGMEKRASKGGSKYRALYILDAVLLADNLRALTSENPADDEIEEANLLQQVVEQSRILNLSSFLLLVGVVLPKLPGPK